MITKIPKQLWRVTNGKEALAYLTSYEDNAAFRKREQTGLRWANGYRRDPNIPENKGIIFDNEPISGFSFVDFTQRYRTDNKLMQVSDPRGFVVETPIKNFFDLMSHCVIDKGVVQGDCIWGREGNNLALIPINSELYNKIINEGVNLIRTVDTLIPGNIFKFPTQSAEYIYYGTAVLSYSVEVLRTTYFGGMLSNKTTKEEVIETRHYTSKKPDAIVRVIYSNGIEGLNLDTVNPERKCVILRSIAAPDRKIIKYTSCTSSNPNSFYCSSGAKGPQLSPKPKSDILNDIANLPHGRGIEYRWSITKVDWKD